VAKRSGGLRIGLVFGIHIRERQRGGIGPVVVVTVHVKHTFALVNEDDT
jgi:hypothetical protein